VAAMSEGPGTLRVEIGRVTLDGKMVAGSAALPSGAYARLVVADTGCGMTEETMERIFDPFFTTKALGQGTGLGLSVVHGIATSHGGAVAVHSTPGAGSELSVFFPAAQAQAAAATSRAPVIDVQRGHGEHILYVDDEEMVMRVTTRLLERLGYKTSGYTDPLRALDAFAANATGFDAVLTDSSMPGLSGPDLVRKLLAIRPGLPIGMVSGGMEVDEGRLARELGIRELIPKPSPLADLAAALHRLLRTDRG
jgi:two-component system, cell cycle sensor histidine kinase and response regulator CckA